MKYLFLILFVCNISFAQWFQVQDLYVEGKKFTGRAEDAITRSIGRKLDKELSLGMNIDFLSMFYYNNYVIGRTSCVQENMCQFTGVAYNFKVGARITSYLDFEYGHLSTHAMDNNLNYYVEDFIGFRFHFINNDKKDSLLP